MASDNFTSRVARLEEHLVPASADELLDEAEYWHAPGQDDAARLALAKHAAQLERR